MTGETKKRLLVAGLVIVAVAAFFYLGLHRFLSLDALKASRADLETAYRERTAAVLVGYFALYAAMAALNLPGATVLTLAGAAVFGFWPALVVVSLASTLGATAACALTRYLFRQVVERRFGARLTAINRGIAAEGAFYLFTLRLVPLFPFFAVNMAMGLTRLPLWTYAWVSQIGMLPGTAVYVNAGAELGRLDSLSGILSPGVLVSFALLGIFPLAAKKALALYRRRRGQGPDEAGPPGRGGGA